MALTSKITNVANKIRDLTGTTGKMTLDEMPSKMDEIKTKPNLQDKSIEITENGTQTIQADEGYDGLNNVNVDVNITGGIVNDNLNIFIQEEEPNIKNGVWLKTNKSYESIEFYNVDDIFEWSIDANDDTIIPYVKEIGVTSIGTDIYIAGGMTYNNVYKNTMYKYDTLTNTYTKLTNLPYSAYGISIISYETDIYIFGGRNNGSTCYNYAYKYDTLSDIYTKLTNMPASIGQTGIARVGTNIYIIGGSINGGGQVSSVYKYDILTDTYTTLEPLPIIRNCPAVCTLDTDIYIFCGFNGEWLKDSYKYDTLTNTYTRIADYPIGIYSGAAQTYHDNIYVFGGMITNHDTATDKTYLYNPKTDSYIEQKPLWTTKGLGRLCGSTKVGNDIYFPGGMWTRSGLESGYLATLTKCQMDYKLNEYKSDKNKILFYVSSLLSFQNIKLAEISNKPFNCDFIKIYYYSAEYGIDYSLSTYIGDGTQWIKLKN